MSEASESKDMCQRPLLKKIILFSLPLIATGILQLLYNAADIVVVGQFAGHTAMAAVGSTGALINLITNLFIGLSVGVLSCMSRSIGANDAARADQVVHTAIPVSLIGGVIVGAFGFFASAGLLVWMQTPESVLPLSAIYLKIYFLGMPFMTLYNFGASVLRACGDTRRPLLILFLAGLVNVALNYILVAWFSLGVIGVAVGTTASQFLSAIAVVAVLIRRRGFGHFSLRRMRINRQALFEMTRIGLPAGIQGTIFSISNVIIQSSINSFGDIAMAGNAAAANLEGFVYISMNSISQACLTFTARNYGARNASNMRLVLYQCLGIVTVVGVVMGGAVYLLAGPLLSIYNGDAQVIAYGAERLLIVCAPYFLCGIMEVVVGSLRGMGCSVLPMLSAIAGVCGIRIVWIYTIFAWNRTLLTLYLSYPISWIITIAIHLICYFIIRNRTERQIRSAPPIPEP